MLFIRFFANRVLSGGRRAGRMAALAAAAGRLARLRQIEDIVSTAEAMVRTVLGCREARIWLEAGVAEPDRAEPCAVLDLLAGDGARLGRLDVWWGRRPRAEDENLLEQFARTLASTLETAARLADITRAKTEMELILSTVSDGMFTLDRSWAFRYANNAASRYLRRPRDELLGCSFWELFPAAAGSAFEEHFTAAVWNGRDEHFTAPYEPLNAWFEVRAYPFSGGLAVYFRDITAHRETEEKLRQSQKLEALGRLTGGIAHDVNNMLTVMLGNFEMLAVSAEERAQRGDPDGAEELALAEAGLRAGDSASQLMRRLLAFSRRESLAPRRTDVALAMRSLEPLLRRTLGEQVSLVLDCPDAQWHVLVDPSELESAVVNLAINAKDAMPEGGTLTIRTGAVTLDAPAAAAAGLGRSGAYMFLAVSDTGTGMTRDVAARAFDPFFTTKEPGKGTGLGLSMVYGFVRRSGGQALIDTAPGCGTTVRLYLPRAPGSLAPDAEKGMEETPEGDETVLLVEDNDLVRTHTAAMLRSLGYTVTAAATPEEVEALLDDGLAPDLLLTDVILPGRRTGLDVADAVAARVPDVRVLFMSGFPGAALEPREGVVLLHKPFRCSELAMHLRAQLAAPAWNAAIA